MANSPFIFGANGATSLVPGGVTLPGATTGTLQIKPNASTASYALTMPAAQGGSTTTLNNDGAGNLTWVNGLPAVGTDGQLLKSMNSTYIQSSYYNPYPNYIGNAFAEVNTNGWATYSNTASNTPVNGTGGTATGLTFSRTTSSPLRDTGTFSIVQTNSTSLQGKGVSYAFTIDSADQARVLSVQLDYNASSTFVASNGVTAPLNDGTTTTNAGNSDLEVFIYDVTNSILLPVSPSVFTANGANNFTFKGTFQTSSNSTSYRLILHAATANANATGWTFKFTNVYVGPQYIVQGSPVTDPVQFAMTIGATTTPPTKGTATTDIATYARFGKYALIHYEYIQTAGGSAGSGTYLFPLPPGLSIDPSFIPSDTYNKTGNVGTGFFDNGGGTYLGSMYVYNATNLWMQVTDSGATSGNTIIFDSVHASYATAVQRVSFDAMVPILGWASTTLMSNDAATRAVVAVYQESTSHTTDTSTPINFDTKLIDTHGAVTTGSGWMFTAPVSGYYSINVIERTNTGGQGVRVYTNGNFSPAITLFSLASTSTTSGTVEIHLTAGQYVDIRASASMTTSGSATDPGTISISQIQGPSQLAVTDSINASYSLTANQAVSAGNAILFNNKLFDTNSAYNTSTGLFTCPISGTYLITDIALLVSGSGSIYVKQNGVFKQYLQSPSTGGITSGSALLKCVAGETFGIFSDTSNTFAQYNSGTNTATVISIVRTGN